MLRPIHFIAMLMLCGSAVTAGGSGWMAQLPDSVPVCRLSIPGSHDSGTGDGTKCDFFAKTQDLGIGAQFDAGIRAFDIRSAVDADSLHIYHGSVATGISFAGVMEVLCDKLDSCADEFVILIMRHEPDIESEEDHQRWAPLMERALREGVAAERLAAFRPDMTVGDMRGRILVLSRDRYAPVPSGGYIGSWSHGADFADQSRAVITGPEPGISAPLWVQDYYETVGNEEVKLSAMERMLAESRRRDQAETVWVINHASGYGLSTTATAEGYRANAEQTNTALIRMLADPDCPAGCAGMVMMDFAGTDQSDGVTVAGASLIRAIIDSNFP